VWRHIGLVHEDIIVAKRAVGVNVLEDVLVGIREELKCIVPVVVEVAADLIPKTNMGNPVLAWRDG
jgi:hypothetical protein